MIESFISLLSILLDSKNSENKESNKYLEEITNNQNLLHWLLETAFQLYILQKEKNMEKPFIP